MARRRATGAFLFAAVLPLLSSAFSAADSSAEASLEGTRLTMDKWIEIQQIISKERKDWQQGKEILTGRLDLVKEEIAALKEKTKQAEAGLDETTAKRKALEAEQDELEACGARLAEAAAAMEGEIRRLFPQLPEPIQTKLEPLYQRIPDDATHARVSIAERFQNVLGILNELNKANNEITVSYEVHTLADGKPSEVRAIYVGLAQAYYVSARGQAGVGRPTADGWKWEPLPESAREVLSALEMIQGKQTPAFVPLPVELQ